MVEPVTEDSNKGYLSYLQIGGARFFNVNSAKYATDVNVFIPIWQFFPSHLVFTHVRVHDRSGQSFEGNLHLGYRYLSPDQDCLYGIYGAFDRMRSENGNYFNQLTFGLEAWFRRIFLGGNVYQPVGVTSRLFSVTNRGIEHDSVDKRLFYAKDGENEKSIGGTDIEIGYEFIKGLVGYVGGYYFGSKDTDTIYGPKARVSYDISLENSKRILGIFDKLGLEAGVQRDRVRGTRFYLSANCQLGVLSRNSNSHDIARHMTDLVRRDVDVVTEITKPKRDREYIGKYVYIIGTDQDKNTTALVDAINNPEVKSYIIKAGSPVDFQDPRITEALKRRGGHSVVEVISEPGMSENHLFNELIIPRIHLGPVLVRYAADTDKSGNATKVSSIPNNYQQKETGGGDALVRIKNDVIMQINIERNAAIEKLCKTQKIKDCRSMMIADNKNEYLNNETLIDKVFNVGRIVGLTSKENLKSNEEQEP